MKWLTVPTLVVWLLIGCAPAEETRQPAAAEAAAVTSAAEEYPHPDGAWEVQREDFQSLMARAQQEAVPGQPLGPRMTAFGRYFVGSPYVAHTLELAGPERLVVNLKELDCVTLVENAYALAVAARGQGSFAEFLRALEQVRYRGGSLDGYTSRLHYFSDWLADAERKGVVRDITREIGGAPFEKRIHFMTSNREAYRQMRDDAALVDEMGAIEERLNRERRYWIPQERIAEVEPRIEEGDIIAITTRIDGLDVSHTGLATWIDGRLHLLHAPDVGEPVEISTRPLAERIRANRMQTGIMVARPLER